VQQTLRQPLQRALGRAAGAGQTGGLSGDLGGDPTGDPTLGEALLAPTTIYVKPVLALLQAGGIDGLAHITGGGLTENIVRVVPDGLGLDIDTGAWKRPAVFDWLQEHGRITDSEMLRTFNCGIGMVMLAPAADAGRVLAQARGQGLECHDIGAVVVRERGARVRYVS
jgi:phosphoribosylformylglycinamidine cyclo-ligase